MFPDGRKEYILYSFWTEITLSLLPRNLSKISQFFARNHVLLKTDPMKSRVFLFMLCVWWSASAQNQHPDPVLKKLLKAVSSEKKMANRTLNICLEDSSIISAWKNSWQDSLRIIYRYDWL